MKSPRWVFPLFAALFIAPAAIGAEDGEAALVEEAAQVFETFLSIPEKPLPEALMGRTYGVAIFPGVRKFGFLVGLHRGRGVLVERGNDGLWGNPIFVGISGESIGWQVGVQSTDLVLFFRTRQSVAKVLRGNFTLGVDAAVAAGSLGRQAGAATDEELKAEILTYARSRGLFAGVSLTRSEIRRDEEAEKTFYGDRTRIPPSVAALHAVLGAILEAEKR
jgi:lipid-binding SYLF domain-containing protein